MITVFKRPLVKKGNLKTPKSIVFLMFLKVLNRFSASFQIRLLNFIFEKRNQFFFSNDYGFRTTFINRDIQIQTKIVNWRITSRITSYASLSRFTWSVAGTYTYCTSMIFLQKKILRLYDKRQIIIGKLRSTW